MLSLKPWPLQSRIALLWMLGTLPLASREVGIWPEPLTCNSWRTRRSSAAFVQNLLPELEDLQRQDESHGEQMETAKQALAEVEAKKPRLLGKACVSCVGMQGHPGVPGGIRQVHTPR